MNWQLNFYITLLIISMTVSGAIAWYSWQRRQTPGATSFALLMLAVTVWSLGYALELWSTELAAMLWWVKVSYLGVVTVPVLWLVFSFQYSGRDKWLTRRNLMILFIIPLIILILNWTNEYHRLYYPEVGLDTTGPFILLDISRGGWYWVSLAYSYLLLLVGTIVLVYIFIRSPRLYRGQIGAVLVGAFIPWIANALYILGLNPFPRLNLTPLAFTLTGLVMAWGLFRFKLLDIVPVARDKVVESMGDGVIVLDAQARIVDINPAAQRLLDHSLAEVIGQTLEHYLLDRSDLVEKYRGRIEARSQIVLGEAPEQRHFELHISPIFGRRKKLSGRLIILHDITERQQAEETLQALNRRMQDELALAHEIQQSLLPPARPEWPHLDVVCYSAPAREVGGDFYRYHAFPISVLSGGGAESGAIGGKGGSSRYAFAVGDVSGKGVSAALLMAASLAQFDAALPHQFTPQERMAYLDRVIFPYTKPRRQNCAMCYVELELDGPGSPSRRAKMHLVNAGCIPPYIRHSNGRVEWPKLGGFALGHGLGAEKGYEQIILNIWPDDLVILTSDGVAEAKNLNGEMFGFERLRRAVAEGPDTSAAAMLEHLKQEIFSFVGEAEQHDDITLLVVKVE